MTIMTPERFLRSMRKTPVILNAILRGVTQERAQQAVDGPGGWSVVEVMCHMRDYEEIVYKRAQLMLEADQPGLPGLDNEETAKRRDYAHQNLGLEYGAYLDARRRLVGFLSGLSDEQWRRQGVHPEFGTMTMLELALNVSQHDVNHIEQIVRALGLSEALV
jgi:DinB family protein